MSIEMTTKTKSTLNTKTKLALLVLAGAALSFGVMSFAMMSVSFEKLVLKKNVPAAIVKQSNNQVLGHVKDVISSDPLSGIVVTFTNINNQSEIYTGVTDVSGNYSLILGSTGDYKVFIDDESNVYYDYHAWGLQMNSFPFIYNIDLLLYTPYDVESEWDCSSEFEITTIDAPLFTYIDRYFELIDKFLIEGSLSASEWDDMVAFKYGESNSIASELTNINNNIADPVYVNENYASALFDKMLCNYRKETGLEAIIGEKELLMDMPEDYNDNLQHYDPIFSNFIFSDLISVPETINMLLEANPTLVSNELLNNEVIEKMAHIFDYQLEFSYELDKINYKQPYHFWRADGSGGYLMGVNQDNHMVYESMALYPNVQSRLGVFYSNGIKNLIKLLANLAEYSDKDEIASLYIDNEIFGDIHQLMTMPSVAESYIPGYRAGLLEGTKELFNVLYPYVLRNQDVQDIVKWSDENKYKEDSDFWQYIATTKEFGLDGPSLIDISNVFNNFCINTIDLNDYCSPHEQPKYCENSNVVDNCQRCGCPSGLSCNDRGFCDTEERPSVDY